MANDARIGSQNPLLETITNISIITPSQAKPSQVANKEAAPLRLYDYYHTLPDGSAYIVNAEWPENEDIEDLLKPLSIFQLMPNNQGLADALQNRNISNKYDYDLYTGKFKVQGSLDLRDLALVQATLIQKDLNILSRAQAQESEPSELVTSESMAFGLMASVIDNHQDRFTALFKTVKALSERNYKDTSTYMRLLPWASKVTGEGATRGLEILSSPKDPHYGNASAADADLLVLTALAIADQKGWATTEMRQFLQMYMQEFLFHDVKQFIYREGQTVQPRLVFTKGGFIGPVSIEISDSQVQAKFIKFPPSYVNLKYLAYLAKYFEQAPSISKSLVKLSQDSSWILEKLKSIYPANRFPIFAEIGFIDNSSKELPKDSKIISGNMILNDKSPVSAWGADRHRLYWATQDEFFKPNHDEFLQHSKDRYYYSFLEKITLTKSAKSILEPSAIAPVKNQFKLSDIQGSVSQNFGDSLGAHYGVTSKRAEFELCISALWNEGLFRERSLVDRINRGCGTQYEHVGDRTPQLSQVDTKLNPSISDALLQVRTGIESDFIGKHLVEKGDQKVLDGFATLLQSDTMNDTWIGANLDYVSNYLEALRSMKGFNDEKILVRINQLLLLAPNPLNSNNSLLAALYLEKILLWRGLSNLERATLKDIVAPKFAKFDLTKIISYMEYKTYADQPLQSAAFDFTVNDVQVKSDFKPYSSLTPILSVQTSETLRKLLMCEAVKSKLRIFVARGIKVNEYSPPMQENIVQNFPELFEYDSATQTLYFYGQMTVTQKQDFLARLDSEEDKKIIEALDTSKTWSDELSLEKIKNYFDELLADKFDESVDFGMMQVLYQKSLSSNLRSKLIEWRLASLPIRHEKIFMMQYLALLEAKMNLLGDRYELESKKGIALPLVQELSALLANYSELLFSSDSDISLSSMISENRGLETEMFYDRFYPGFWDKYKENRVYQVGDTVAGFMRFAAWILDGLNSKHEREYIIVQEKLLKTIQKVEQYFKKEYPSDWQKHQGVWSVMTELELAPPRIARSESVTDSVILGQRLAEVRSRELSARESGQLGSYYQLLGLEARILSMSGGAFNKRLERLEFIRDEVRKNSVYASFVRGIDEMISALTTKNKGW